MSQEVSSAKLSSQVVPEEQVISAFSSAQTSIQAVVYKFDNVRLLPALFESLNRGVSVQILFDEKEYHKSKHLGAKLATAGAEVRLWPRSAGKLHAKFLICDKNRVNTGSYNWTISGGRKNVELLQEFVGAEILIQFEELFQMLWIKGQPLNNN